MHDNVVLISIKAFSSKGMGDLKGAIHELSKYFKIEKLSSVYKVNREAESLAGLRDIRTIEQLEGFAVVIKAATSLSAEEAMDELSNAEIRLQREYLKRTVSFNLMALNDQIVMLPGISIPHPEMHLRPEELIPAVEIWPDYEHPVLKVQLNTLARGFVDKSWGEFFAQSQGLLDF